MTQTSCALFAVYTLERVDSLILEINKSNASASFSGVRRESFSSSEQMTPRPFLSNLPRIQNAHRVYVFPVRRRFHFSGSSIAQAAVGFITCCDLNEIRGNESLYCFEASGSVLGCED